YEEAANWYTRQRILSLFVNDYSKSELLALIPGLSKWRIDEARKHAFQTKPGQPIDPPRITRCRLDTVKVDHFLDFLSSPSVLQDVAYGTRTLKLESGESLETPNMVRTVISSHLVRMYLNFCVDSNGLNLENSLKPKHFVSLQVCGASLKKSLAGLDSTQTDGVQALATLEDITHQLKQAGLDSTMADNILMRLKAGRQYLKTDFKIHTASESPCADHCRVFALSRTEKEYNGQCQHQHTITCDRCEDLKNAVSDLQLALDSGESFYKREELQHDLSCAAPSIEDWKSHVLRSVHQDAAKNEIVDSLKPSQVLLIIDWAVKFIPTSFRETQRDWFGKKGKSWPLPVAITKAEDGTIEVNTPLALDCDQVPWHTIHAKKCFIIMTFRREHICNQNCFPRSDNAGCYHCPFLLLSLPSLGERIGVRIARYDFSEAQAGKDICDRRAAALKSHIRRYINEGNDVKTASDMKAAIDSHGGVKGCYSVVCKVDERSQNMTKHPLSGIQSLKNFVFTESGEMIAWRAYNVGPGKVFSAASL
ncbi:unnamed protein product, partial [Porites evermanni]